MPFANILRNLTAYWTAVRTAFFALSRTQRIAWTIFLVTAPEVPTEIFSAQVAGSFDLFKSNPPPNRSGYTRGGAIGHLIAMTVLLVSLTGALCTLLVARFMRSRTGRRINMVRTEKSRVRSRRRERREWLQRDLREWEAEMEGFREFPAGGEIVLS